MTRPKTPRGLRRKLFKRFKGRCRLCGKPVRMGSWWGRDGQAQAVAAHIYPVEFYPQVSRLPANLVLLCLPCERTNGHNLRVLLPLTAQEVARTLAGVV